MLLLAPPLPALGFPSKPSGPPAKRPADPPPQPARAAGPTTQLPPTSVVGVLQHHCSPPYTAGVLFCVGGGWAPASVLARPAGPLYANYVAYITAHFPPERVPHIHAHLLVPWSVPWDSAWGPVVEAAIKK
jgi:hypothetical protein